MAYNSNKGPQHSGDIQYEGDPNDVQIDFENDQIILRTGGAPRVNLTNTELSASGIFRVVGSVTGSGDLAISGTMHIGDQVNSRASFRLGEFTDGFKITGAGDEYFRINTDGNEFYFRQSSKTRFGSHTAAPTHTVSVAGDISGSGVILSAGSISSSADVAVTGNIHATAFYGDGSNLSGVGGGSVSGSARHYSTTGLETSGYLKVSGSSTLNAVSLTTLSGSGLAQLTSVTASADLVASGSVIVGENKFIGIPTRNMIEVKDGSIVVMGLLRVDNAVSSSNIVLATSLSSSGDCAVTGNVHATAYYGDGSNLSGIGASSFSGSARHYSTTGLETSGYLKVSSSATLAGPTSISAPLTLAAPLSSSATISSVGSISSSADLAVSGNVHASAFYGDGSGLLNLPAGSVSGSVRHYSSTGLETSGYLKVSGSSTLNAVTATTYSGSSTMQVVGATILGGNLNVSGSTIMEGLTANGITNVGAYSGSSTLQTVGNALFGGTIGASGSVTLKVDEPTIHFSSSTTNLGTIGFNNSSNILVQNETINKHIVFKCNDGGTIKEGLRLDGAVPEVVVNQNGASGDDNTLVNFRVESDNNEYMLYVQGSTDRVGINTSAPSASFAVVGDISGSDTLRLVGSISSSADIAVTGAIHAAAFYGDGSGLSGVGGGSVSGSARHYSSTGLETSGYLKVSGSTTLAGTVRSAGMTQFTAHGYNSTSTQETFIPFFDDIEATAGTYRQQMIAPMPGRLLKVWLRSKNAQGGNVIVKLYKAADGTEDFNAGKTEVEAVTATMTDANTSYAFTLSGSSPQYSAGEIVGVSIKPNANGGDWNVTCVWEYNDTGL
tara:strand:- start:57 stop:2567 length:2511 start_codon:yes stop_codon:yes gene_type:complete